MSETAPSAARLVEAAKKTMRAEARTNRSAVFAANGDGAAQALAANGLDFIAPERGQVVSGFLAIGEEIDPLPLMQRLHSGGVILALPVMQGKGKPLLFRRWHPLDDLVEVKWGIREPLRSSPEVVPDFMLVPLLAFDEQGFRLGYGGGFYDRSIAAIRGTKPVVTIGVAYDEQEVPAVPRLDYDQRLDWILTPSGARSFAAVAT